MKPADTAAGRVSPLVEHARHVAEELGLECREISETRLGAALCAGRLPNGSVAYLKVAEGQALADLEAEHLRLAWVEGRLPVPNVLQHGIVRLFGWMLLSSIDGVPSHLAHRRPLRLAEELASYLHRIHRLDTKGCPFTQVLAKELAIATNKVAAGRIDPVSFASETGGLLPQEALAFLKANARFAQETVFTHGDYCMPNVLIQGSRLAGFVDWGQAGVGDKHRDLMAMADSIRFNLGEDYVDPFFVSYGEVDQERIRYFSVLDQFFAPHERGSAGRGD
jgi:aminoglycoside phosphotransferase